MGPHQGRLEGEENLPHPAGHTLLDEVAEVLQAGGFPALPNPSEIVIPAKSSD